VGGEKMPEPILVNWSSGKDSALSLYELQHNEQLATSYELLALLTTLTSEYERVSMHGVRRELLEEQAASIGLPLELVLIPPDCSNEKYESLMHAALTGYKERGVSQVVSGDIFLEDIREYRDNNFAKLDMKGLYPIWGRDSRELAESFISLGFKAVLTCVDTEKLDASFSGREYDAKLLEDLPPGIDPCGENGEFHTFCYAGPIFKKEIAVTRGEVVLRDKRFSFCDLLLATGV
jgi:uncharacterized protein (TIGR00290 family)